MKFSTPFIAKELKSELKNAGIKVLRCKQSGSNALVTIANVEGNKDAFESFAKENNYGMVNGKEVFTSTSDNEKYYDYGNVFKYINVS